LNSLDYHSHNKHSRNKPYTTTIYKLKNSPNHLVSGNILSGGSESNRISVGSTLSRLATNQLSLPENISSIDIVLSSYPGTDARTDRRWKDEFQRALRMIASPTGGATLFAADFTAVPSTAHLAEWIATKWAPVILRSYDIAGIRVGARLLLEFTE
jgi:hypothetical protein